MVLKPRTGFIKPFEFAMISFDNIVQVFYLPVYRILWAFSFFLQFSNSGAESRCFVCIDCLWMYPWFYGFECFAEKPLGRLSIAGRRKIEINCVTTLVNSPV